ncbi:MAG: DUF3187 family protein [Myxococcaceae bacterium]
MPLLHLVLLLLAAPAAPPEGALEPAEAAWAAWSDFPGQPLLTTMDPLEYERSGLFAPPLLMPKGCFAFSLRFDYASAIQLYNNQPNSVLLDAEIGHLTFAGALKVSPTLFLFLMGGVQGAYAGFMDQFLNWYHGLFGIPYAARAERPLNKFAYYFQSGTQRQTFKPVGLTLLDTSVGVGWMLANNLQLLSVVVVPTASVDGYAAHTFQFGAMLSWQVPLWWSWLQFQGTLGFGGTPQAGGGLLQPYQNVVFGSFSTGLKARLSERNFIYANFFLQSPIYHHTGDPPLDVVDGSLDFGWMFRTDSDLEFWAGITENPVANGIALDVVFTLGIRYGL